MRHEPEQTMTPAAAAKLVARHWQVVSSVLMFAVAIGVARGRNGTVEARVEALEATHPDVTAAMTERTATDVAAVRTQVDHVRDDCSAIRVDVASMCATFGIHSTPPPLRTFEAQKAATVVPIP